MKTLNITANGAYPIVRGGSKTAVYIYGTIGTATIELHGPGGLIEDGAVAALPFETVVNHGGNIQISIVVTGAGGTDVDVRFGPIA